MLAQEAREFACEALLAVAVAERVDAYFASGVPHSEAIIVIVLRSTTSPTLSCVPMTWSPNSPASRAGTLLAVYEGIGVA